ncbi:MAG: hypothetical protein Ct9H90mP11_03510 [Acidimicrobiales bacterium]|nr:MAG: hypothetical protein Ct9H90mP11_03510 [Acidimicrobiales bacterium]
MVLDVCPPIPAEKKVLEIAVERTHKWAIRGRNPFLLREKSFENERAQFGIVQGGLDPKLDKFQLSKSLKSVLTDMQ